MSRLIQIGPVWVQKEILTINFRCDLAHCKGACCVIGTAGPPVSDNEIESVQQHLENLAQVTGLVYKNEHVYQIDPYTAEKTLAIFPNEGPCIFTYTVNGVTYCSLQKCYDAKSFPFPKPISCHLFPLIHRILFDDSVVIQLDRREECEAGFQAKEKLVVSLREPLIRLFGEQWYRVLLETAEKLW